MENQKIDDCVTISGDLPGSTVAIIGSVHGNERVGAEILDELSRVKINAGKLHLILGNPRAFNLDRRQTEENLNRCFGDSAAGHLGGVEGTYERERALAIQRVLSECDAVLDIHQSKSSRNYVICGEPSVEFARVLDVDFVCTGFYDVHPGSTDYYMEYLSRQDGKERIGVCIEVGSYLDRSMKAQDLNREFALRVSKHFISEFLNLNQEAGDPKKSVQTEFLCADYIYKTRENFRVAPGWSYFDRVRVGDRLGTDGETEINVSIDWDGGRVLFMDDCNGPNEEAFVIMKDL